jgi:hypothetical protein
MKKHFFKSLAEFYPEIINVSGNRFYNSSLSENNPSWYGLSLEKIKEHKFSYPMGVEKLSHFKDFEVQKDTNVKFWNQYDGFDIDVERMMDNLDFLLDNHKKKSLPKTMDIYINTSESAAITYDQMLCKTYATIKIIDRMEALGVRCAVYSCASLLTSSMNYNNENVYLEICIKNYSDTLNIGAICTAISPWFFRYWMLLYIQGRYANLNYSVGIPKKMPSDINGVIIETGACYDKNAANNFIESIKL